MVYCLYLNDKTPGIRFKYNTFPVSEVCAQKWPHELYSVAGGRESRLSLSLNGKEPLSEWTYHAHGFLLDFYM